MGKDLDENPIFTPLLHHPRVLPAHLSQLAGLGCLAFGLAVTHLGRLEALSTIGP